MNRAVTERKISISFVTQSIMHNITSFLFSCDAHVCFFLAVFLSLFCICPFFFQFWSNHNSYTRIQRSRIKEKEESESYSSVKLKIRRKEDERNILQTLFDRLARKVSFMIFSFVLYRTLLHACFSYQRFVLCCWNELLSWW